MYLRSRIRFAFVMFEPSWPSYIPALPRPCVYSFRTRPSVVIMCVGFHAPVLHPTPCHRQCAASTLISAEIWHQFSVVPISHAPFDSGTCQDKSTFCPAKRIPPPLAFPQYTVALKPHLHRTRQVATRAATADRRLIRRLAPSNRYKSDLVFQ